MTPGGNNVEVKFGGSTSELDAASNRAAADIEKVGNSTSKLGSVFNQAKNAYGGFTAKLKSNEVPAASEKIEGSLGRVKGGIQSLIGATSGVGGLTTGVEALSGAAQGLASAAGPIGLIVAGFLALAAAGLSASEAILEFGERMGDNAEKLDQISQKIGFTVKETSGWGQVFQAAGSSTEAFSGSMTRLERALVAAEQGGKRQSAAFKQLGIDVTAVKSPSEALLQIADKFAKTDDGPKKTAIAMQLMGRAGASLIPVLNMGRSAIEEQIKTAESYGAVVDDAFIQKGLEVDDAFDQNKMAMQGLRNVLFEALAPAIATTVNLMNSCIRKMYESYKAGGTVKVMVEALAGAFKVLMTILVTVGAAFVAAYHATMAFSDATIAAFKAVNGDIGGAVQSLKDAKGHLNDIVGVAGKWADTTKGLWGYGAAGKPPGRPKGSGEEFDDVPVDEKNKKGKKDNSAAEAKRAAAEARRLAEEQLRNELEDLSYKQDMQRDYYDEVIKLEQEKVDKIKAFYGEDSREYTKALRDKAKMERDHLQEINRLRIEAFKQEESLRESNVNRWNETEDIKLQSARDHEQALEDLGLVGGRKRLAAERQFADEEVALNIEHENRIFSIHEDELMDELSLDNLRPEEQRRINLELERLRNDHENKLILIKKRGAAEQKRIDDQTAAQSVAKWKNVLDPIGQAFNGFLQSMLNRSQTFGQAVLAAVDSIVSSFLSMGVQMLTNWIAVQLGMGAVHKAQKAEQVGTEIAATSATAIAGAASRVAEVMGLAAVAAAATFASIAAIPVVGPPAAPAAAASAYAAVAAMAPAASAAGGYDIPSGINPITQLHAEEMVLPSRYANPLRDILLSPKSSSLNADSAMAGAAARSQTNINRGGDANFHYSPSYIHEKSSLSDLLRKDGKTMRKWVENEIRDGRLSLKS